MSTGSAHILVVDDDERLRALLGRYLGVRGFTVTMAGNAAEARDLLEKDPFDALVLDVMMPGESGVELTRSLKENPPWPYDLPILLLTAMGEPEDRVRGLESGADDYLAKPFEPEELALRLRNLLKRPARQEKTPGNRYVIAFGDYVLHVTRGELRKKDQFVRLTSSELALLTILAQSLNVPVPREEISRQLRGISERSVDVQVTRLRRKIEADPSRPVHLQTAWGRGYVLRG